MTPLARDEAIVREHERFMWGDATTEEKRESAHEFDAALARIVGQARAAEWRLEQENHYREQARDYEKALREHTEAARWEQDHGGCFCRTCNAALAGAGVTDNERTVGTGDE